MEISDDTVAAFVDGELDAATAAAVEAAIATDAGLERRVGAQRRLRAQLQAAFGAAIDEPVPDRLLQAVRTAPGGLPGVSELAGRRTRPAPAAESVSRWPRWYALAASVAVGALLTSVLLRSTGQSELRLQNGQLLAQGALHTALDRQLASSQGDDAAIKIGLSFRDHAGQYCRTFTVHAGRSFSGMACHEGDGWSVQAAAPAAASVAGPAGLRMAGSAIPEVVLQAVQARQQGEALDAAAEKRSADSGWR